jgi:alkylation response protein AidB-like acyl-CoA dehydrogenase
VGVQDSTDALLERARVAARAVAPLAARIEQDRRLPPDAVQALVDASVFKLLVPRVYGGADAPVPTVLEVFEEIAAADGSAGWCAMIGATSGLMSRFLGEAVAREVYAPRDAITCGVFAPFGRATRVAGGFRVSGRWPFASGCAHSRFRMGGAIVDGDPPGPGGAPQVRSMLFHAEETQILDTWDVSGLRGTGSHDLQVKDVFVPDERSFSLLGAPVVAGPEVPFFGLLAAGVASVAIGIARGAVDAVSAIVRTKHPMGSTRTLAHRELVQRDVGRAEAKVRGARAFLREAVADAAREASACGAPGAAASASRKARALLRLAAAHATTEAAAAVDLAYELGGIGAVDAKSPLQRAFRDVHVATQHIMVNQTSATLAGRVLLGVDADVSTL